MLENKSEYNEVSIILVDFKGNKFSITSDTPFTQDEIEMIVEDILPDIKSS